MDNLLKSCACSQAQLASPEFQKWCEVIGESKMHMHRKPWEWCYIAQALHERKKLMPGQKGIGFAVGQEPLAALFAKYGCDILATDLDLNKVDSSWVNTNQHSDSLADLNKRKICTHDVFNKNVKFTHADMNDIPKVLKNFDFCWSACAMEHLGSIEKGKQFIFNMLSCLKPGGIAVHTTEFNISSNTDTCDFTQSVLFRKRDLIELADILKNEGHHIELDFTLGDGEADRYIDTPPYKHNPHLRVMIGEYVSTSFGLVITKACVRKKWWKFWS